MFRFTFSCVSSVRSRQSYRTSARRGKALRNLIQLQCAFDTYNDVGLWKAHAWTDFERLKKHPLV
ncbi:hypothetical protein SC09_Contig25orf01052 [Bacillus subtilis]|uniref:Uncharacterized protein n=1 Tax=Bacillus subtilis TaxID=1423 RepID=A0A0D1IP80_BACIU|nr:hypothetical protein SC09_Contig25orf01052 [Bacillus subtilis]